ncbi:MerR family transcriptional regulator [Microbacterium sp. 22242]|uniref:MerR family transcriptional regulator n=1 Tax=Microbacterium sp. 22242 TaxID=3453896 RepID=UPI003F84A1CF
MTTESARTYSIAEAAAMLELEADTLRYFERRGVIPRPHRDAGGRRVYADQDIHLLEVLQHLRKTGMPLADIAAFTRLVGADPQGVPERLALLEAHRAAVIRQQEQLRRSLRVIDQKIRDYRSRMDGLENTAR